MQLIVILSRLSIKKGTSALFLDLLIRLCYYSFRAYVSDVTRQEPNGLEIIFSNKLMQEFIKLNLSKY